jgi:BirA family biotin operon repressor/biotin-[acetyl-CoA-carboxylase] ligase
VVNRAPAGTFAYDGLDADALALRLGVPRVAAFPEVPSTLDVAHALAADGAPAGTLVLADRQSAGRGRGGRSWSSPPGGGIWLTLVERPADASALEVLSLRLGLRAARALEPFAGAPVGVKWPNDVYVAGGKLGGILVEARWRDAAPDWAAVGMGVNVVAPPDVPAAGGRAPGVVRLAVLDALVPALRSAIAAGGPLRPAEVREFDHRHVAQGRRCVEPGPGTVEGVSADGALLVRNASGVRAFATGSLVLESAT